MDNYLYLTLFDDARDAVAVTYIPGNCYLCLNAQPEHKSPNIENMEVHGNMDVYFKIMYAHYQWP